MLYNSHEKFRQCCFSLTEAAVLVADNLSGLSPLLKSSFIQMANGAKAVSGFQWHNDIWEIQGYNLLSNSKMFILKLFDVISGCDGLKWFNLMTVHWSHDSLIMQNEGNTLGHKIASVHFVSSLDFSEVVGQPWVSLSKVAVCEFVQFLVVCPQAKPAITKYSFAPKDA
jgi:hypothetical protein